MSEYILTKEECLAKGGHVWDTGVTYLRLSYSSVPTKGEPALRVCKYCGHRQHGYYPDMVWEDVVESK